MLEYTATLIWQTTDHVLQRDILLQSEVHYVLAGMWCSWNVVQLLPFECYSELPAGTSLILVRCSVYSSYHPKAYCPTILPSYHPTVLPSYHPTILPSYRPS